MRIHVYLRVRPSITGVFLRKSAVTRFMQLQLVIVAAGMHLATFLLHVQKTGVHLHACIHGCYVHILVAVCNEMQTYDTVGMAAAASSPSQAEFLFCAWA